MYGVFRRGRPENRRRSGAGAGAGRTEVLTLLPTVDPAQTATGNAITGTRGEVVTVSRATSRSCMAASGVLGTVAIHAPALETQGLSIEALHVNLILFSEQGGTGWTTGNATTTANLATAPDGALTADKLDLQAVPASVASTELYTTTGFTGSVAPYTFSVWMRTVSGTATTWIHLTRASGAGRTSVQCNVTTTWQRFSITLTLTAVDWYAVIGVYNAMGQTSPAASLYVWGAQVELGSYARSYRPTSGASSSVSADGVVMSGFGALPVAAGELEVDVTPLWTTNPSGTIIDTRNVSPTNGVALYVTNTTLGFIINANPQTVSSPLTWVAGTTYRIKVAWGGGTVSIYRDGALAVSAAATMPTVHSQLRLGSDATGASTYLEGNIKNMAWYTVP